MYIFKTSGSTFDSVIFNQKHAFKSCPKLALGELIIVSKNKRDCKKNEKQIQYIMKFVSAAKTSNAEIDLYWPGNHDRWEYLIKCDNTKKLSHPFNLHEILGDEANKYDPIMTFGKISYDNEIKIENFLKKINAIP